MRTGKTDYERLEEAPGRRRLLRREELVLEVTEAIVRAMDGQGVTRAELARRLGCTRSYVTQFLAGRNLRLATLADIADALGVRVSVDLKPRRAAGRRARAS